MKALSFLLQAFICSGILYGYYYTFLRNERFHLYNRYYLLAASLLSVVVPLLNIPVYFSSAPEQPPLLLRTLSAISSASQYNTMTDVGNRVTKSIFSLERTLMIVYAMIGFALFCRFLLALSYINKLLNKYVVEKIDHIYFINSDEPGTPFSFFRWLFWNNKIDLQSENGKQIFKHELFHIQQRHSADVVFLETFCALFWINPFLYLLKQELQAIHEFLADEFASKEKGKWSYAELLLIQVLDSNNNHLVNSFFQNQIKRRIAMITSPQKASHQYLRKIMVLPLAAAVVALFAFKYKEIESNKKAKAKNNLSVETKKGNQPFSFKGGVTRLKTDTGKRLEGVLFVINGKIREDIKSSDELDKIVKPEDIASIQILKESSATSEYGDKGNNGVVKIVLKNATINNQTRDTVPKIHTNAMLINTRDKLIFEADTIIYYPNASTSKIDYEKALVIINGKKERPAFLKQKTIISHGITLYSKDDVRTANKFGEEGKNGVIVFENAKILDTPPAAYYKDILSPTGGAQNSDKIFERVEIDPQFPGGETEWRNFLQKNLNTSVPVQNGWERSFTVWLQFVVDKEGNISGIQSLTNFGYGMEEEAVRVMKLSPKWIPAMQNGQVVTAYTKIPITFNPQNGIPSISPQKLKEASVFSLLKVPRSTKVISFSVSMDNDNGGITQTGNVGNEFCPATLSLFEHAAPGKFVTVEEIYIELNGKPQHIPSLFYQVL